jgi:hypothetical protein
MLRPLITLLACVLIAVPAEASCVAPLIKQHTPYKEARAIILDNGFYAPRLPAYGYDETDEKVVRDCFNSVELCNRYPEIASCSGSGLCRMEFADAYGNQFAVITYGDLASGDVDVTDIDIECRQRQ